MPAPLKPDFDIAAYVRASTKASGVPTRLRSKGVIRTLGRLLKRQVDQRSATPQNIGGRDC